MTQLEMVKLICDLSVTAAKWAANKQGAKEEHKRIEEKIIKELDRLYKLDKEE